MATKLEFPDGTRPSNSTVKLTDSLRKRITSAMEVAGYTVWAEFCRVALSEKCSKIESELETRSPKEFERRYGRLR